MRIEVTNSYTIDYVSWTCPMCGYLEETFSSTDDLGICTKCGFEIPDYNSRMGETDGEIDIYEVDQELEDFMEPECPNCGTIVDYEGQYCPDCEMEMGAE